MQRLGNPDLVPLHRIDRDTAGLVLFSANPATRDAYQSLFRHRRIHKRYEAIAPALPGLSFPLVHASRLEAGEPFFRMREVDGAPNSETRIDVIERGGALWRYALEPVTGRKHQLRVHMAALGAPIRNDRLYPQLTPAAVTTTRGLCNCWPARWRSWIRSVAKSEVSRAAWRWSDGYRLWFNPTQLRSPAVVFMTQPCLMSMGSQGSVEVVPVSGRLRLLRSG